MGQYTKATTTDEIKSGGCVAVKIKGVFVGIYNIGGEYYAINNICPHLGGVQSYGSLTDNVITCPLHMWEFDVTTGDCIWPGQDRIATYPVKVKGKHILVNVDSPTYQDTQV